MKRELAPSIISAVGLLTGAMITVGCDESGYAGDGSDEAADAVTDAAEDVADDVQDASEDAEDELEDVANEVKPK